MKTRKARKRTAFKFRAVAICPPTLHTIVAHEQVKTDDGIMELVSTRYQAEFVNPDNDIAVMVGSIPSDKAVDTKIWYWRDKFWLEGIDTDGITYYKNHQQLLYEIEPENFGFTSERALASEPRIPNRTSR